MYENINFSKANMTVIGGYFYMFDKDQDILVRKLDDGTIDFTYPLDTLISEPVKGLEFDAMNFWTLQQCSVSGISIKRWHINNNICNLEDDFICEGGGHFYDSETFTVEHYHTTITDDVSINDVLVCLSNYVGSTVVSGTILTLGPNALDQYEEVVVNSVSGTCVTISSGTRYSYINGNKVNFYKNLWVFNNYDGMNNTGALYKFDAHTGSYIEKFGDSEYKDITACAFARVNNVFSSNVDALLYVRSTNLKFVNINTLANYGTMTIDNLRVDGVTVIPIYDLAIFSSTIYRLQDEATYYGTDNDWTPLYNYQVSTTRPFIDSITVTAYPLILPANAVNITNVTAMVFDQYGNGARYKPVYFTDNDDVGYITINPAYTDYFWGTGEAKTAYRAGVVPQTVNIEGTATQND